MPDAIRIPRPGSRAAPNPNLVLNRLFVILNRSFASYVAGGDSWTHAGDERAQKVVQRIITDDRMYAGRLVELLLDRRVAFVQGEYPMMFTDTNDLSLDYLVLELICYQKQDIAAIEQCVADLSTDLTARALAEEILGNARGHLESLQGVVKPAA